jgi:uncharacterized membrane protein YcaP (DUF421 family)
MERMLRHAAPMDWLWGDDWAQTFLPQTPLLELVVRGTVMYLGILLLLRVVLRRETGQVGVADLLVIVFLADAAQNGMAGDYRSIADGIVLVATIIAWTYALDALAYHIPPLQGFLHPSPRPLVVNGRLIRPNMRREFLTEEELMSELRLQGVDDVGRVKKAQIEGNGQISVVLMEESEHQSPREHAT